MSINIIPQNFISHTRSVYWLKFGILCIVGFVLFFAFTFSAQAGHVKQFNCTEGHPAGFVWSRGVINCIQETCPADAIGRDYGERCKCSDNANSEYKDGLLLSCFAKPKTPPIEATIIKSDGDIEYSKDGGKTFIPLTSDIKLETGNIIATSFDSRVSLDFGYGILHITPMTTIRIDKYVSEENIKRTQMALYVGTVRPIIKRPASIRGDFSVSTPTANSSIRGSEMEVKYDKETNITTVLALEGIAYVKGINDIQESTLSEGQGATIGANGIIQILEEKMMPIINTENPKKQKTGLVVGIILVAGILSGIIWNAMRKKRTQ